MFLILIVIAIVVWAVVKIMKALPSFKELDEEQKERILKKFLQYNNENRKLYSAHRVNGCGTGFYRVRSFTVSQEKIKVLAKMPSAIFFPLPFIFGYIVCYNGDKIISSISTSDFKQIKREIEEEIILR